MTEHAKTDYGPETVEPDGDGWKLIVRGVTDAASMSRALFPSGVPHGVTITEGLMVTGEHPSGEFVLHGLNNDAMDAMEPWWGRYLSQAMQAAAAPAPHEHGRSHGMGNEQAATVHFEKPEDLRNYVLDGGHGVLTVAELAGIFAEEGSVVAEFGEFVAGPIGDIAAVVEVIYLTWHEFGERLREEHNRGVMFGEMWQVLGHADLQPTYNEDDLFAKQFDDSFEDMKKAFEEGVPEGRAAVGDVRTHNLLASAIAWQMHVHNYGPNDAADIILTQIWQHATGGSKNQYVDFP